MDENFTARRRWFDGEHFDLDAYRRQRAKPGVRCTCPCCGYPTLKWRWQHEICQLCKWQDDGQDELSAEEVWGGPNKLLSLAEARRNFHKYLVKYDLEDDPRLHPYDSESEAERQANLTLYTESETEQQAKLAIMSACDRMVGETDSAVLAPLWGEIERNKKILDDELDRRIREYEAQLQQES